MLDIWNKSMEKTHTLNEIAPFFIVDNLKESLDFYKQKLGFKTDFVVPKEDPFFGIVSRDEVRIILKQITEHINPIPNHTRHEWARWDAFIWVSDPDSLYAEYQSRGLTFHEPLADTDDGLRAFEIKDNNRYVLCFGKPLLGG